MAKIKLEDLQRIKDDVKQSMTLERATQRMRQKYHVHVPPTTLHDWVVAEMKID